MMVVGLLPVQAPLQPMKVSAGEAVNWTILPDRMLALQTVPQLIPPTSLVTVPVPDKVIFSVCVPEGGGVVVTKVAVQFFAASIVTEVEAAVPVQSPLQPVKVAPEEGIAVKVTVVPKSWVEQLAPQLVPAGFGVTMPFPLMVTLSLLCLV